MKSSKKLYVFDFDDTLVTTDCKTLVAHTDGTTTELTPADFVTYEIFPGDVFDFAQFRKLINPRELPFCMSIFRGVYAALGSSAVAVLSARVSVDPINEFLAIVGMTGITTHITPNPDPRHKADWIDSQIVERDLDEVEFFDDAIKNITAVRKLRSKHLKVGFKTHHIVDGVCCSCNHQ